MSVSVDNQTSTSTKTVYKIDKVLSKSNALFASDKEISPASGTDSTYNVATFANKTHKDLKTSYQIGGTKELSGRSFKPGDSWTFTLSAPEGTPLPQDKTVTVSPSQGTEQAFVFDSIEYGAGDIGKTYTYTVAESGSAAGVTNDADSHTVTVTIGKDDESGAPVVNAEYANGADASGNLLRFVNTYHASGWVDLAATKDISGRSFAQGDAWTFDVSCDDVDAPMPAETSCTLHPTAGVNTQAFSFGHIDYTEKDAGKTYTYKVTETGDVAGVANDSAIHTMTVSVSDNGDGSRQDRPHVLRRQPDGLHERIFCKGVGFPCRHEEHRGPQLQVRRRDDLHVDGRGRGAFACRRLEQRHHHADIWHERELQLPRD